MGHHNFYNKNQIRDKLLLVLIFLFGRGAKWLDYCIGLEKRYYMRRVVADAAWCVSIMRYAKMMGH